MYVLAASPKVSLQNRPKRKRNRSSLQQVLFFFNSSMEMARLIQKIIRAESSDDAAFLIYNDQLL
jgi:hypothetical protein